MDSSNSVQSPQVSLRKNHTLAMEPNPIDQNASLINSFCEITSSSKEEALFFLESHHWNLDAAVSTFLDNAATSSNPIPLPPSHNSPSHSPSDSPDYFPSRSPSRSRSPSPIPSRNPYQLRTRRAAAENKPARSSARGIRTLADLNRTPPDGSDSDSEDGQDYYTGGEKSGMVVRDPSKRNDVEAIFNQARQLGAVEGSSDSLRPSSSTRSFTGTARLLSGETVSHAPQPPEVVSHNITFWRNGYTVDNGPLQQLDDPANASFLESIMNSRCPKELEPADGRTKVDLHLIRRDENYSEPQNCQATFQGVGRTLGGSSNSTPAASEPNVAAVSIAPLPSMGLVVDDSLPTTSIQLRLADGTRMVSRFNYHHTIRDIRGFIEASRAGGARNYQLLTMGFPPKQLADLDQTIEQAGIASSVVIQKF